MVSRFSPEGVESDIGLRPSRLTTLLGFILSAGALVGVVVWITRQEAPEFPSAPWQIAALAGAVGVYTAATLVRGERWWCLLQDADVRSTRREACELTAIGYMGNNVLPARAGDAMKVLMVREGRGSRRAIVGTLVAERILDVVFLLLLFILLAFTILRGVETPDAGSLVVIGGGAALVLGVAALGLWLNRSRPSVARFIDFLSPLLLPTRRLQGRHLGSMTALTGVIWALEVLTYFVVARALEIDMSFIEAAYLIAVASVFLLIPSGPGYVGTLDAAILFGLGAIDVTGGEAVSFLLVARFVVFVPVTLAGLVLFLLRVKSRSSGDAGGDPHRLVNPEPANEGPP